MNFADTNWSVSSLSVHLYCVHKFLWNHDRRKYENNKSMDGTGGHNPLLYGKVHPVGVIVVYFLIWTSNYWFCLAQSKPKL